MASALVVDAATPDPGRSAGERATVDLLQSLPELGFEPIFLPLAHGDAPPLNCAVSRRGGTGVDGLARELAERRPDVVIAHRPGPGLAVRQALRQVPEQPAFLYCGHDLHGQRLRSAPIADPGRIHMVERAEQMCWRAADVSAYPTQAEAQAVGEYLSGQGRAVAVPYFRARPRPAPGPERRQGLLFVGGAAHEPNRDAVRYLLTEVLPAIRALGLDDSLTIVGDWPNPLLAPGVRYTGRVSSAELAQLHDAHLIALAPLRFGAGAKGKVVDAMAQGLPTVTTTVGARGLLVADAEPSDGLAIADTPAGLAAAVQGLHGQRRWRHAQQSAWRSVESTYGDASYLAAWRGALRNALGAVLRLGGGSDEPVGHGVGIEHPHGDQ